MISSLKHPNIVSVYSIGLTTNGAMYIAMELLDGAPLSDLIAKDGALDYRRMIPLFIQACDALEHAHKAGIIHRDIKPSNLVITTDESGNECLKVVDFGLAKVLSGADITHTTAVVGSAYYMSPGRWESRVFDTQSDIYALGCSLFEVACCLRKEDYRPAPPLTRPHRPSWIGTAIGVTLVTLICIAFMWLSKQNTVAQDKMLAERTQLLEEARALYQTGLGFSLQTKYHEGQLVLDEAWAKMERINQIQSSLAGTDSAVEAKDKTESAFLENDIACQLAYCNSVQFRDTDSNPQRDRRTLALQWDATKMPTDFETCVGEFEG